MVGANGASLGPDVLTVPSSLCRNMSLVLLC